MMGRRWIVWASGLLMLMFLIQPAAAKRKKRTPVKPQDTFISVVLSEKDQQRFDYFYLEAVKNSNMGQYAQAYELLKHALDIHPQAPEALFEMANYIGFLGNDSLAQTHYEQAVLRAPHIQWYREVLANYYLNHNQLDKAIGLMEKISADAPENTDYLRGLLQLYYRNQAFDKSIDVLNRIENLEGKSEALSMEKFRIYLRLEQKEQAFDEIEKLVEEYPNDLRYRVIMGDLYLENEDKEHARQLYQEVLNEEPGNVSAQLSMSTYFEQIGQPEQARSMMEKILFNPASDTGTQLLIMKRIIQDTEAEKSDSTYVLNLFDKLLEKPQENSDIALLSTQYKMHKQMGEEVITASLRQVLALNPDNHEARLQLMDYAFKRNDYADAAKLCKESIEYLPDELAFYYYLGASLMQLDKNEEALQALQTGVEQVKENSDKKLVCTMYGCMGDIYHEMNELEKTYQSYDKALTYNPDDALVLNNYAYFLSLEKKDLEKAEEMSFRTIKQNPQSYNELDTYAWILFIQGRYTEAKIYIGESLKNGGDKEPNIVE
ncbi:MAG: tetratricopeptide repeat protein, partial [Bacteroidales bacterium]|nr:tetratricopeptide repeat protein [Candidatus Minthousia equi]